MLTDQDWLRILTGMGVHATTAAKWTTAFVDEVQTSKFSAGEADLVDWLPQILHEFSMLERTEENLVYTTPERIRAVWPSRFPTIAAAVPYVCAPQKLANLVYGGRMGNTAPGDGWLYRGRPMLTGASTYRRVGDLIGQDLLGMPHLIEQHHYALVAAIAWWEDSIPDAFLADQSKIRRRVQGAQLGLEHCAALAQRAREVFA